MHSEGEAPGGYMSEAKRPTKTTKGRRTRCECMSWNWYLVLNQEIKTLVLTAFCMRNTGWTGRRRLYERKRKGSEIPPEAPGSAPDKPFPTQMPTLCDLLAKKDRHSREECRSKCRISMRCDIPCRNHAHLLYTDCLSNIYSIRCVDSVRRFAYAVCYLLRMKCTSHEYPSLCVYGTA